MVTGPQIRAARGLLGWSAPYLAKQTGLGVLTIQRAEAATGVPPVRMHTLICILEAINDAGVGFIEANEDHGAGVCFMERKVWYD